MQQDSFWKSNSVLEFNRHLKTHRRICLKELIQNEGRLSQATVLIKSDFHATVLNYSITGRELEARQFWLKYSNIDTEDITV